MLVSVSHGKERSHSFVTLPIKPCRSLTLNSPIIIGSEVGRAALLDSDGREDKNKVGKESALITQGAFSRKQIKIARNGSALTRRLETGNWGRVLGRGIEVLLYKFRLSFPSDSLFSPFFFSCFLDAQETYTRHTQ